MYHGRIVLSVHAHRHWNVMPHAVAMLMAFERESTFGMTDIM